MQAFRQSSTLLDTSEGLDTRCYGAESLDSSICGQKLGAESGVKASLQEVIFGKSSELERFADLRLPL